MDSLSFDRSSAGRNRRRRALAALLLATTVATVGAGAMSLAVFTDNSQATGGSWTTGTIILGVTPTTAWTATNVLPGDAGNHTITVSNTGTGQLRYAVSTGISGDTKGLAAQMQLAINVGTCAAPGASLYSGSLTAAAIGDPAQGVQGNERTLDAATSESLCFAWTFPLSSANTFQGAATTATFNFAAEQTTHNP